MCDVCVLAVAVLRVCLLIVCILAGLLLGALSGCRDADCLMLMLCCNLYNVCIFYEATKLCFVVY